MKLLFIVTDNVGQKVLMKCFLGHAFVLCIRDICASQSTHANFHGVGGENWMVGGFLTYFSKKQSAQCGNLFE